MFRQVRRQNIQIGKIQFKLKNNMQNTLKYNSLSLSHTPHTHIHSLSLSLSHSHTPTLSLCLSLSHTQMQTHTLTHARMSTNIYFLISHNSIKNLKNRIIQFSSVCTTDLLVFTRLGTPPIPSIVTNKLVYQYSYDFTKQRQTSRMQQYQSRMWNLIKHGFVYNS